MASQPAQAMRLPALDGRSFAPLAKMAYDEAGIVLAEGKVQLVQSRLARRLRLLGLAGFDEYVALIARDPVERAEAIDALTTNHTKFFREQHHFEHFVAEVWPALRDRLDRGGRVRIWSAACSSGEEPYTLAMALLGADRGAAARLAKQDFRILATDLSRSVLATAQAGRYPAAALEGAPSALRQAWTVRSADGVEIHPDLRALISFRPLNLLESWPMRGRFDVIFCRNVMIYFDEPTKERLQTRFADNLVEEGTLYIGHSERLLGSAATRFAPAGQTIYRRNGR